MDLLTVNLLTVDLLTVNLWPLLISTFIMVLCMFYLWEMAKSYQKRRSLDLEGVEAFVGSTSSTLADDACYDDACYDATMKHARMLR